MCFWGLCFIKFPTNIAVHYSHNSSASPPPSTPPPSTHLPPHLPTLFSTLNSGRTGGSQLNPLLPLPIPCTTCTSDPDSDWYVGGGGGGWFRRNRCRLARRREAACRVRVARCSRCRVWERKERVEVEEGVGGMVWMERGECMDGIGAESDVARTTGMFVS